MKKQIEIYIRSSADNTFLNFYIDDGLRDQFLAELATGYSSSAEHPIHVELSIQSQWITDETQRKAFEAAGEILHCRIPISNIEFH